MQIVTQPVMASAGTPTMNFVHCAVSTGPGISSGETHSWPCFQLGQSLAAEPLSPAFSKRRRSKARTPLTNSGPTAKAVRQNGFCVSAFHIFNSLGKRSERPGEKKRECGRKCNPWKWAHADTESVQHP